MKLNGDDDDFITLMGRSDNCLIMKYKMILYISDRRKLFSAHSMLVVQALTKGLQCFKRWSSPVDVVDILNRIHRMNFKWGFSDGS